MMKALSIRQPHAEAILRGMKRIEYRSQLTRIRGRIYIYASMTRYSEGDEAKMMSQYRIDDVDCSSLPRGVLVGTVELVECRKGKEYYEWSLEKPKREKRLRRPVGHPQPV